MKRPEELSNYKSCTMCGRALPINYEKDYCPACEDDVLFREIREYIRKQLEEDKLGTQLSLPYAGSPFTGRK